MTASERVLAPFHDFFLASAGVAGALIGLLFVAISVAPHRVTGTAADPAHRIRASAALTAFSNALTISLFALIPTVGLGGVSTIVGTLGLLFVAGSLLSVVRLRRTENIAFRDVTFLVGQFVVFVAETIAGANFWSHARTGSAATIAILTVVGFVIGIARAWELIGATTIGLTSEVAAAIRGQARARHAPPPE
jgi:uncharacterized protein with PQ loop repeat